MMVLRGVWLRYPSVCLAQAALIVTLIGCGDENMPRAGSAEVHLDVFLDFTEIEERGGNAILGRPSEEVFRTLVTEYAAADTPAERSRIVDALENERSYTALLDLLESAGVPTKFLSAGAFSTPEPGASDANAATVRFLPLYDAVLAGSPVEVSVDHQPAGQSVVVRQNTIRQFLFSDLLPAYVSFFDSVVIDASLPMDTFPQTHLVVPFCRYVETLSGRTFDVVNRYPDQVTGKLRVMIYSDLVEHSPIFSFYRDRAMEDSAIVDLFMTRCKGGVVNAVVAQRTQIRTQSQPVSPPSPNDPDRERKYRKFQEDEARILRAEGVWVTFFQRMKLEHVGQFR